MTPTRRALAALLLAALYGVSPVDAVPDAVPLLGLVDDLGVGGLAALLAAWWMVRARAPEPARAAPA